MPLKLTLSSADPLHVAADVAVLGVPEGPVAKSDVVAALVKAIPAVKKQLERDEFTGKKDQTAEIVTNGAFKPARVLLVGLGKAGSTDADVRLLAARAGRFALAQKAGSLVLAIPAGVEGGERAAGEGLVLGSYRYTRYLTGDRIPKSGLTEVTVTSATKVAGKPAKAAQAALTTGQAVGEAVCIARDLINEPPNELYPETLAKFAADMCKKAGLECKVFDKAAIVKKGMKLLMAVGQGSARDPRFIHMTYKPAGKAKKRLVFVGKGLTFDTGGICIKPAPGMEEMKGDMGGAANVIALMRAVAAVKPNVEVHGLVAAAENMPDGNAYRPGDVFGSLDGKTVEIINTDAEGRLVLADALAYGRALEPDMMLDNATLTGACVVALGPTVSGFFANRDDLADRFRASAKRAGEAMWQLPLVEDLRDGLKSDWADLKHMADRWGGSITAALFLREFVGDVPWVHVDIAGPSMANKAYDVYAKGGTGHGVRTYLALIDDLAKG
jgi:leucyl aminopeptidase